MFIKIVARVSYLELDRGSLRSSLRYGLSTPYRLRLTIRNSAPSVPRGIPAFGPSCTEFVYPECWHFDNDATSKIEDVLTEHGGLLHVLPLAVHLQYFFCWTILSKFYSLGFVVGPSFMI